MFMNSAITDINFSPKLVREQEIFGIDFTRLLAAGETIVTATPTVQVQEGVRHSTVTMCVGPASISGNRVTQMIRGGVAGNIYSIHFTVTTSLDQTLEPIGLLQVIR